MADKAQQTKEVESTVEEVEKTKPEEKSKVEEKAVEEEEPVTVENGEAENGDSKEDESKDDEDDKKEKNGDAEKDVCSVKRKSTGGGDATDNKPEEGATPEKKAKLEEPQAVA